MTHTLPQDYYQRLHEIQAVDFFIVELMLYLDTHPDDMDAIKQYNQYAAYSKKLKAKFVSKYGPLTQGDPDHTTSYWSWKQSPWPWQV
ncbi:spore coat protein CotJB [Bacillus sp. FSL K6-0138]|uniref:spore coat protein CotJB n=1 Tax=Bacillus sp. FSL K6-0138 TaxID=2921422 RepID=UPI0030EC6886